MSTVISQGIGFLGLLAFIVSYQTKSNRTLYLFQMAGVLLFTLQFALFGALSGCYSLGLMGVRNLMLYKYNDWAWIRRKVWPALFCVLFTVILYITWAGPISLLAYTAAVVSTIFYWTNNARNLRAVCLFVSSPCWLVYDILVGSWGGLLNELFTMGSIIVSIARFGWRALGDPESEFQK